jgi:hypothetical protein
VERGAGRRGVGQAAVVVHNRQPGRHYKGSENTHMAPFLGVESAQLGGLFVGIGIFVYFRFHWRSSREEPVCGYLKEGTSGLLDHPKLLSVRCFTV